MIMITSKSKGVRKLTTTAVLAALSAILMYLEFSVPLVPSFLRYDFSDLPAIVAAFGVGPLAGVAVELIKNLLHLPVTGTSGVGELANFIIGSCFVLPAGIIYKYFKNIKGALIGATAGTLIMSLASLPVNYFITYPFYTNFMPMEAILAMYMVINPAADTLIKALLMFNLPFTFIKGLISVIITFLIYKKISPLIHGKQ